MLDDMLLNSLSLGNVMLHSCSDRLELPNRTHALVHKNNVFDKHHKSAEVILEYLREAIKKV